MCYLDGIKCVVQTLLTQLCAGIGQLLSSMNHRLDKPGISLVLGVKNGRIKNHMLQFPGIIGYASNINNASIYFRPLSMVASESTMKID